MMEIDLPSGFRLAESVSTLSNCHIKVGAVIRKGNVTITGHNQKKTHPVFNSRGYTLHAEAHALIRAGEEARGAECYVYRATRNGNPALAKPCAQCLAWLIEAGVKRIYYTIAEAPFYAEMGL